MPKRTWQTHKSQAPTNLCVFTRWTMYIFTRWSIYKVDYIHIYKVGQYSLCTGVGIWLWLGVEMRWADSLFLKISMLSAYFTSLGMSFHVLIPPGKKLFCRTESEHKVLGTCPRCCGFWCPFISDRMSPGCLQGHSGFYRSWWLFRCCGEFAEYPSRCYESSLWRCWSCNSLSW